jgi:uncharacterized protein YecA (UPF0149 family)
MNNRNKPCKCGSGKKYKKCHYIIEFLEKEKQQKEQAKRMMKLVIG